MLTCLQSVLMATVFSTVLLLGRDENTENQVTVSRQDQSENCQRLFQVSTQDAVESKERKNELRTGTRIIVTFPWTKEEGIPVAAILDDTNHEGGEGLRPGEPHEFRLYFHRLAPKFALWANGKVLWIIDSVRYYQGQVAAGEVQKLLSSIQVKEYNTPENMRYSYAGYRLVENHYAVLFVSKGKENNVILCSPFHYGESFYAYSYWDESSHIAKLFLKKEYSWQQFSKQVPRSFLTYLQTWESLESKLVKLKPKTAAKKLTPADKITLISYVYEYREDNPPKWIQVTGLKEKDGTNRGKADRGINRE